MTVYIVLSYCNNINRKKPIIYFLLIKKFGKMNYTLREVLEVFLIEKEKYKYLIKNLNFIDPYSYLTLISLLTLTIPARHISHKDTTLDLPFIYMYLNPLG